jgi:hypothetical protein
MMNAENELENQGWLRQTQPAFYVDFKVWVTYNLGIRVKLKLNNGNIFVAWQLRMEEL